MHAQHNAGASALLLPPKFQFMNAVERAVQVVMGAVCSITTFNIYEWCHWWVVKSQWLLCMWSVWSLSGLMMTSENSPAWLCASCNLVGDSQKTLLCNEMHVCPHAKCPLLLSNFNQNWNVSTDLVKLPQYEVSHKSVQQFSTCCMQQMDKTDMKLTGAL
jgi:hypothetical protein